MKKEGVMYKCAKCGAEIEELNIQVIVRGLYDISSKEADLDSGYPFNRDETTTYECPECGTEARDPEQLIKEVEEDEKDKKD